MPEKEPTYKSTFKDVGKRIKSIKIEHKWTHPKMVAALNINKQGLSISESTIRGVMDGRYEITGTFLKILIEKGYSSDWILTGVGEKKIDNSRAFTMTDLHVLRVELKEERSRVMVLEASIKQTDKEVEYLKHELELIKAERIMYK